MNGWLANEAEAIGFRSQYFALMRENSMLRVNGDCYRPTHAKKALETWRRLEAQVGHAAWMGIISKRSGGFTN